MPSFDEMLKDMPLHKNFYIRGVMNSLLPDFADPTGGTLTEKNISGEAIEMLRAIAQENHPNLKDGEVVQMMPTQPNQEVDHSLGDYGLTKQNGQYVIFDVYDFSPFQNIGLFDSVKMSMEDGDPYMLARYLGMKLMPENADGSSRDDAMRIHITLPNEPVIEEQLFEDEPEPEASEFVFRGAMTPKRYSLWKTFSGQG